MHADNSILVKRFSLVMSNSMNTPSNLLSACPERNAERATAFLLQTVHYYDSLSTRSWQLCKACNGYTSKQRPAFKLPCSKFTVHSFIQYARPASVPHHRQALKIVLFITSTVDRSSECCRNAYKWPLPLFSAFLIRNGWSFTIHSSTIFFPPPAPSMTLFF